MQLDEAIEDVIPRRGVEHDLTGQRGPSSPGVAEQIIDDIRDAAGSLLAEQRLRAAETVHGIAEALHRTAETLQRENVPLAAYADHAADRVAAFSMRIREQRWSDLVADAEALAHRQPALFLAGAISLGFIAGRFLTASERRDGNVDPASSRAVRMSADG
jgi:hypothetical protein